jgi:3-hydroxyisobutyrate dehydrogenase
LTAKPRVGFAGMGRMGQPMARRILAAGFPLTVTDLRAAACAPIAVAGATAVRSAAAVTEGAAFVITCVPGPKEVEDVFFAADGILSTIAPGTIVLEMSTIDVALSRRIGDACLARGCRYLDAPISGGVDGATAGTLAVMVGGDAATLEDARALLESMAQRIVLVGPAGAGHFTKLINQVLYLGYIALFCEATAAADEYGITRTDLIDVLRHSVGGTPLATHWEERLLTRDPAPGFEISRVLKDLRLGAQAYAGLPYDAPIFAAALAAYESAAANGHAGDDVTAVLRR